MLIIRRRKKEKHLIEFGSQIYSFSGPSLYPNNYISHGQNRSSLLNEIVIINRRLGILQLNQFFTFFFTTASYECHFYEILKGGDRSVDYKSNKRICDDALDFSGWYRFMGAAGTQMSTSCAPKDRCGTRWPLWMNGEYPTEEEGRVKRRVCDVGYCCQLQTEISVRNCSGFYVHKFSPPPICPGRYCGYSPAGKAYNSALLAS